ncbi:MAG: DUF4198 domain-containing protein [Spongiibacteraceae bacterium]
MKTKAVLAMIMALTFSIAAQAHRVWILPAATVLSGEQPWVTMDAAVSNDIFHFDHHPLKPEMLTVIGPDGKTVAMQNAHVGKHRSTFDLELKQEGTYKVFSASNNLQARWEDADGKRKFWPARGQMPAPGDFEKSVPKKAKNLDVSQSSRRLETFVTAGAPSNQVLALSNEGLEMKPITHPNDLFNGETAKFQFYIDGEAAVGTKVTVIRGGMHYRNSQDELTVVADKKGIVSIEWPNAGMYWLEAEYEDSKGKTPATKRRGVYIATLEVLPQ